MDSDLEEEVEEMVAETCEVRRKYSLHCAKELEKCIKLTNEMCMTKVITTVAKLDMPSLTNEECAMFEKNFIAATELLKMQEHKLQVMIDKIDNLTAVFNQIKKEETCEINKLLQC